MSEKSPVEIGKMLLESRKANKIPKSLICEKLNMSSEQVDSIEAGNIGPDVFTRGDFSKLNAAYNPNAAGYMALLFFFAGFPHEEANKPVIDESVESTPEEEKAKIRNTLKKSRAKQNLSAKALSRKIGKNETYAFYVECGKKRPVIQSVPDVVKAYGLPEEYALVLWRFMFEDSWKLLTRVLKSDVMRTILNNHEALDEKVREISNHNHLVCQAYDEPGSGYVDIDNDENFEIPSYKSLYPDDEDLD